MFPMGMPGTLPGPLGQFPNMIAVAVAAGVVGAAVAVADATKQTDAARPNKRSKWDKVPLFFFFFLTASCFSWIGASWSLFRFAFLVLGTVL